MDSNWIDLKNKFFTQSPLTGFQRRNNIFLSETTESKSNMT